jgi:hypothetical protein
MASEDQFDRIGVRAGDDYATGTGRNGKLRDESGVYDRGAVQDGRPLGAGQPGARDPLPRPTGSPLPMGAAGRPLSGSGENQVGRASVPPPGRALSVQTPPDPESAGTQWLSGVLKQAVPFVQKLLPLLDGQIASAVANLISRPHTPPPAPRVDLQPIENGLAELQIQQASLNDRIADQNASLKRVEDHLEMVREATDRNTLEQQELIEDLKVISSRTNRLAFLFLALLVISVLVNIALYLHIQRVLP